MFRTPGQPNGDQSSDGGLTDLQSLLERIDLQGTRNDSTAVDEVAENLRARLNIRVDDEAIFKSLASQLLGVTISGSPENKDSTNPTAGSPSHPSPVKEPELQKTWSGETSSTDNSQPEMRNPPGVETISGSTSSSSSPASLEQQSSSESHERNRGRSPSRENGNELGTAVPTPDIARGNSRPPTSDGKSTRASRRSPSPFRLGNIFSWKAKDTHTGGASASPAAAGPPLRTNRSFERSASANGNTTPSRPPMSPYPPSSESSFGSSMPPTPHNPGISIVGLARDATPGDMSPGAEFSTPLSSTPVRGEPAIQEPNRVQPEPTAAAANGNPTMPSVQAMDHEMFSPSQRGRERARTPSRRNPRLYTPSHSRSQSLPRTIRSEKSRSSPFRNMSPGRFFSRFASPAGTAKAAKEQPSKSCNREVHHIPMEEDASLRAARTSGRVAAPAPVATTMPTEPLSQAASLPKSSPLKTPASRMANDDNEIKTGKHKLRRKMTNPMENTSSPASVGSADESLSSLEGELPPPHAFPAMFNVNLSNPAPKSQQAARGKRMGATRRNTAPPMSSQPFVANLPQAAQTPAPTIHTNLGTFGPEPMLTPMDTESNLNVSGDSFEGSGLVPPIGAMGQSSVQFSIGGTGATGGRRQAKRGSRVRTTRPSFKQQTGVAAPPVPPQQPVPTGGGMNHQPTVPIPTSAEAQTSLDHARILVRIGQMRDEGRQFHQAGDYRSSTKWFTDAINLYGTLDPRTTPGDMLALLLSNRAAGLLMIRAVNASIRDCKLALEHVSPMTPPQYLLANDSGPVLKAKLHTRMARALLKRGDTTEAERALNSAIDTAETAMAICEQVHNSAELSRNRDTLSHIIGEATLEIQEVQRFQILLSKLANARLPSLQPVSATLDYDDRKRFVEALSHVGTALTTAPCCLQLHEKKIALLANLRRWREVASHCERVAAANVLFDGIPYLAEDYVSMKLFPDAPPAQFLKANFFGNAVKEDFKITDYDSACLKLGTAAAAEGIMRLPHTLAATYIRALRLEERYPPCESSLDALDQYLRSKSGSPEYNNLSVAFGWLAREGSKLHRTRKGRNRADETFRSRDFGRAADMYGSCLKIDSEGAGGAFDSSGMSGGRLHAVLHCNRAACLMSLNRHEEAIKECSLALRIHTRYMKALLRRARCYSRLQRYEEGIADNMKWLELVEEVRKSPDSYAAFIHPCLFDGPKTVTEEDIAQVKTELEEMQKEKERKQNHARDEASYRQERQKFHDAFTDAQRRRDHWYNQQGTGSSRRWDSFNDGPGSKRSPKQKNKHQSYNRSDSRPSQNSGYASRAQNNAATAGTHYGVLEVTRSANEAEIKKAYRKVSSHCC